MTVLNTRIKLQKEDLQTMPPPYMEEISDEDVEMVNLDLAKSEMAAFHKDESTSKADLSLSSSGKSNEIRTAGTDSARHQSKQQQVVVNVPQVTATEFEATHHPEQGKEGSRKRFRSGSVKGKELVRDNIPASEFASVKPEPIPTNLNPKRMKKTLEQHTDSRRGQARIPFQKVGTSQQQQQREIQNYWKQMCRELHERDNKIDFLNSCIEEEKESRDFFEYCMDALSRQNKDLYRQHEDQTKECNHWRESFQDLDRRHTTLTGENSALKTELDDRKKSHQRAMSENKALHERVEQQELSVTKAQNAAMSVLSHSLSAMLPDNRIRTRFGELFESIAEWARDNAAAADQVLLTNPDNILKWEKDGLLRHAAKADSDPDLNFDLQDDTAVDTLLNAAMARKICRDFLGSPFWFVGFTDSVSGAKLPQGERFARVDVLDKTLKEMMEYHRGHEANVHTWRALTVQTLAGSDQSSRMISASYGRYLEESLLPKCAELVRNPLPQSDKDELMAIIESFGDLAIELWSEKPNIKCQYLDQFERVPYHHADKRMEIARAVGIEANDAKLDGRPIPVLVQPLIVGCGTHDGKDYDKHRIWSKAVVWVSKNKKSATAPADGGIEKRSLLQCSPTWQFRAPGPAAK